MNLFAYRAVGGGTTSLKLVESRRFMRHSTINQFTLSVRVS